MSSTIDPRSAFFPRSKNAQAEAARSKQVDDLGTRNSPERANELNDKTSADARVNIGDGVKDFARIKKAAIGAPEVDNTEKIARLRSQIQAGSYDIDYDQLADKILAEEF